MPSRTIEFAQLHLPGRHILGCRTSACGGAFGGFAALANDMQGLIVGVVRGGSVVKRKCGTCRFFQDAQIACSGWCTHPDRGDIHDLVLVRRAELACRNSWDRDLWEPGDDIAAEDSNAIAEAHVPPPRILPPTDVSPVTPDNPTDRVTSIDVTLHRTHPAVAGGQDDDRRAERPEQVHGTDSTGSRGVSSLEPSFQRALFVTTRRDEPTEPAD